MRREEITYTPLVIALGWCVILQNYTKMFPISRVIKIQVVFDVFDVQ